MNAALQPAAAVRLDTLGKGNRGVVARVDQVQGALPLDALRRLIEIGFVPGERVEVVATAFPGGDPIAVRIGTTQFALRRLEARCVWVAPDAA